MYVYIDRLGQQYLYADVRKPEFWGYLVAYRKALGRYYCTSATTFWGLVQTVKLPRPLSTPPNSATPSRAAALYQKSIKPFLLK